MKINDYVMVDGKRWQVAMLNEKYAALELQNNRNRKRILDLSSEHYQVL